MRRIVLAGVVLAVFGAAGCGSGSASGTRTQTAPHTTATQTKKRYKVTLGTEFDVKNHTSHSTTTVSPAP